MIFLVYFVLILHIFTPNILSAPVSTQKDLDHWGINMSESAALANRTLQLKKLAIEIQELRGVNVSARQDKSGLKASSLWDDIQMNDDLITNLKAVFEEEKAKIMANKTGDTARATAPDFALIPFAKWTQMPIKYSAALVKTPKLKNMVGRALQEIQTSSGGCISFEEVTWKPNGPFIVYVEHPSLGAGVCANSPLGKQPDGNMVNVATSCQVYGTIIHETLHSLGFAHTQQRPDVEQFLKIDWSNIMYAARSNFKPWKYALKNQGEFDFSSILMYPRDAFAVNDRKDTLTPKVNPERNGPLMGQRDHLSDGDVAILKRIYCAASPAAAGAPGHGAPTCADSLAVGCGYFKLRGYCTSQSSFASWVQDSCAKTCKLC